MVFIDSNILLDIWQNDPLWASRSTIALRNLAAAEELAIISIIFAEVSVRFASPYDVERAVASLDISILGIPNKASFFAGKAFQLYRKQGGTKTGVLPDFFIGGHAEALGCSLLTRDAGRYRTYFPTVPLIAP
jgi:predicted nucleic acid-binding protein